MTCVNCGTEQTGKYCSNCGQSLHVKRITLRDAWDDIWEHVSGFDGKFARTFKDLSLRPGFAAREFINGNRARYYGPVGYYLLMITVFLLWLEIINVDYVSYLTSKQETISAQDNNVVAMKIREAISDNLKIFAFFIVPFIAFASRRIYFRKQGLNFLEHSVPVFYMLGHWFWFQMIEATVYRFSGYTISSVWQLFGVALYVGFGYTSFVTTQPKTKLFLKGLGVYLTGFFFFVITVAVLVAVTMIVIFNVDPSQLDSIRPSKNH